MTLGWNVKLTSGFKLDLVANIVGVGWSFLVQIVCIPLYLRFLGIEAYGLIGFYLMLQAMLQVLDFGLSPTMNREMARYSVQPEKSGEARDLVRTLETGYWLIGIVIGAVILAAAPIISAHWIKASSIPMHNVEHDIMLMGILTVFQWPVSFYQGGLMGLGRQVLYNGINITLVTLANAGAALLLWRVSRSLQAFFLWLIAVYAVRAILLAIFLWQSLPPTNRPSRFDVRRVRSISHFAAGMSGIALTSLILTQTDKVIVSKLLPLRMFGYYTLAWAVASGLSLISGAIFNVVFPRFSAQVAAGDENSIRRSYHRGSQLMAVIILPLSAVLSLFSFEILRLWTRSNEVALNVAPILSILVIGSALNALLYLPYALQLAYGWTRLSLYWGLISTAIFISAILPMTRHFGAVGAATAWASLNILSTFVVVSIMHRHLLRGGAWGYICDIGPPLLCSMAIAGFGRIIYPNIGSTVMTLIVLSGTWVTSMMIAILAAPQIRVWALIQIGKFSPRYIE